MSRAWRKCTSERSAEKEKRKRYYWKEYESVSEEDKEATRARKISMKQLLEIARTEKSDLEKALELQKQLDEREEVIVEADPTQDQNQSFVPKDSKIEKEVMKRSRFDFQKPPIKRQKIGKVSGSIEEQSAGEEKEVSEEELKKLLVIVLVEDVYIEAL
ncbi:hypothetical protein Tco_0607946 [Tanacetum coccineum]